MVALVAPVVDLNGAAAGTGATLGYTENAAATAIAPAGVTTDIDSADFNGGSLTVHFSANGAAEDQLTILTDGTVTVSSGTVSVGGLAIGTVSGGANGADLLVSFNTTDATPSSVSTLIEHIGYADNSDNPSTAARSVLFTVDDGDGASGSDTATINITVANDAPDLTPDSPTAGSYTEQASPTQLLATGAVADPDVPANFAGGGVDLQITGGLVSGDAIVLLGSSGFTISAGSLIFGGNTIGTISGNDTSHVQVTNLTAFATPSVVNSLVEAFGFHSTSEDPGGGDRTVKVTFDDGGNTGGGALTDFVTQTVHVTPVNDAPGLTNVAPTGDYTENAVPVTLAPGIFLTDPDPFPHGAPGGNGLFLGATVKIASGFVAGDRLLIDDPGDSPDLGPQTSGIITGLNIAYDYDGTTGTLTLTSADPAHPGDTLIDYSVVLKHVMFDSTSDDPTNGGGNPTRTITWQVQDAGGTANGGTDLSVIGPSTTTTLTVHPTNDAPVNTVPAGPLSTPEDTALAITGLSVRDVDIGTGNITVTLSVTHGTIHVRDDLGPGFLDSTDFSPGTNDTSSVTFSCDPAFVNATLAALNGVVYTPDSNYNGSDTLTMLSDDGGATGSGGVLTDSDPVAINITAVNDAPVFSNLGGASHPTFVENGSSVVLDNNVTVSDPELNAAGNYGGAILTLSRNGGANPDDTFAGTGSLDLADSNGSGENVSLDNGATFIGTFTQPGDGTFSITFNASATAANVASVMQQIVYANASDNPEASVQIDWNFSDGNTGVQGSGGAGVATGGVTVDITQVDDAPVLINVAPTAAYVPGTAGAVLSSALGIFDPDAVAPSALQGLASATIKIESGFFAGDELFVNLATSGGHFVTPDGDPTNISVQSNVLGMLILSGNDTVSHYQSVLDAVSYHSTAADPSNGGINPTRNISWQVDDGALNSQTPNPDPNNLVNETVLHFDLAPAVDLDASGAGTGFTTTFTENGAPIAIVDTDVSIVDPDNANLDEATIVLTNAKETDALSIAGALPGGIDSSIDTSVPGQITVHLLNSASLADYRTALGQVRFVNSSEAPNTTDRDITVSVANSADSNVAHATIHVMSVDDAPVAANSSASGSEDTPISGVVSATDVDNTPSQLSYSLVGANGGAAHGTVVFHTDGSYTYSPVHDFNGSDSFSFKANDGQLDSNVATVSLTVSPVNDAPVAANGSAGGNEDTSIAGAVSASDVDNTPAQLSYALVGANGGATHGTVALNANGTFTYTPAANFNGSDSFSFKASDGSLNSNVATESLTIAAVNDAPVAANSSASGSEDTPISGSVSATDVDNTPAQLSYFLVGTNGGAAHGTVVFHSDGSYTYNPVHDFNGSDSFSFRANDGLLDSNVATVSLTVSPVNDAPVAANGSASGNEDTTVSGTLSVADVDNTAAQLSYNLIGPNGGAAHGTVVLHADGSFAYTPASNFNGSDSFSFKANDGALDSNVATESLTISAVNDAPVNTVPNSLSVESSLDAAITGLAVSDVDAVSLTTSLHVEHGTLTVAAVSGATVVGNGTGTVTLSGSVAQIDATLGAANNVLYHSAFDFSGTDHLTMTTNDGGGTGSGGPQTDIDIVDILDGFSFAPPHLPFSGGGGSGAGSAANFNSALSGFAGANAGNEFPLTAGFTSSITDTSHVVDASFAPPNLGSLDFHLT